MNSYRELRERHKKEVEAFPLMFAFSNKQFEEGMASLGLLPTDTDKIYRIPGVPGGFYRKDDAPAFHAMLERQAAEHQAAIEADETGEGFIRDMFIYALDNHEYGYTGDFEPALDALGLTVDEINENPRLLHGFKLAERKCRYND